jgi:uncharacterized repeat protein (TIGR01451 family)
VTVDVGTIPGGGLVTISFQVTIDDPLPPGTTEVANQGTVTSNELPDEPTDDPDSPPDDDETRTPITIAPELAFEKSLDSNADEDGSGDVSLGDTLTYRFVATNTDGQTLTGVTIVDPLPGLSALSCTPAQPATLAPGQSLVCTATYIVTEADVAAGLINNTATADSDQTDPVTDPETVLVGPIPVGGTTRPLSLPALLAPWLALIALLLGAVAVVWRPGARK